MQAPFFRAELLTPSTSKSDKEEKGWKLVDVIPSKDMLPGLCWDIFKADPVARQTKTASKVCFLLDDEDAMEFGFIDEFEELTDGKDFRGDDWLCQVNILGSAKDYSARLLRAGGVSASGHPASIYDICPVTDAAIPQIWNI